MSLLLVIAIYLAMAGGKDTQEYETIRKNMVKITTALAGVAERALLQVYIAHNWIDANVKEQTGQELVVVALGRIELDTRNIGSFFPCYGELTEWT